jgi:hypothetical protein
MSRLVAISSSLALALVLSSCRAQRVTPAFHVVLAGSRELVTSHFQDRSHAEHFLSRAASGDTTEHESVVTRVDERTGTSDAGPTILRVTTGHYSGGDYSDSMVVRRADLRPVREHLAYVQRRMDKQFDYAGNTLRQRNVTGDSALAFGREYTLPVFAFSEIDMIVRSLPFRPGYTAILPLYSEGDDALEMDSVSVIDTHAGPRWTIRFADPAIVATYSVDAATRQIVSYDVTNRKSNGRGRKVFGAQ